MGGLAGGLDGENLARRLSPGVLLRRLLRARHVEGILLYSVSTLLYADVMLALRIL